MLFNSLEYMVFLPSVAILYFIIPHRFRWFLLLGASCFFYMSLVPYFILFISVTIINDYTAGRLIEKFPQKKKLLLLESLIVNIGILFVFKYYNFFVDNIAVFLAMMKMSVSMPVLKIIMPVGLSFYTFKSIGYVLDVYRGDIKSEKHFGLYALYLLFFPEILAGPIDRGGNLLPQFREKHNFEYKRISDGLKLIAWGAFKKVVIADRIAVIVNHVYGDINNYPGIPLIINSVLFTFQMYYDFSGYSDIAIGSGKILGFNLPENFNVPLISQSITEFWRRWHISLSTWLRDYLYTPMAIATRAWGIKAIVFSTFTTFVIAGLWHGAGWTFIIFGALHGGALVYEILTRNFRKKLNKTLPAKFYNLFCNFLAFFYLTFTFIFFRSQNLAEAWLYITKIFTSLNFKTGGYRFGIGQFEFWLLIIVIIFSMIIEVYSSKREGLIKFISSKQAYLRWGFYYFIVLLIIFYGEFGENNFIYFKF